MIQSALFGLLLTLFSLPTFARPPAPSIQKVYQQLFVAHFLLGVCQAKEQAGLTSPQEGSSPYTIPPTTTEEQRQCQYVKRVLALHCFEQGSCPPYPSDGSPTPRVVVPPNPHRLRS